MSGTLFTTPSGRTWQVPEGMRGQQVGWCRNRKSNLQVVERASNAQNLAAVGRSPYRGVAWCGRRGKWRASLQIAGVKRFLGEFTSEEEAAAVAAAARRYLMPHSSEARAAMALERAAKKAEAAA